MPFCAPNVFFVMASTRPTGRDACRIKEPYNITVSHKHTVRDVPVLKKKDEKIPKPIHAKRLPFGSRFANNNEKQE